MLPLVLALLGAEEWILVILVVVIFFGAAKIPELARSLGRAKGEFEKGAHESKMELEEQKRKSADARPIEDVEADKVRAAAAAMGIATEGRSISELKAELRAKTA